MPTRARATRVRRPSPACRKRSSTTTCATSRTRYDFDSLRVGIQPFTADFRGFLFQDDQLGVRLFGTRDNNRWQYNLAWFRRLEKDTNMRAQRRDPGAAQGRVFVANLYRQDLPVPGFTSQVTVVYNRNREGGERFYDDNGFLVRPAVIGDERGAQLRRDLRRLQRRRPYRPLQPDGLGLLRARPRQSQHLQRQARRHPRRVRGARALAATSTGCACGSRASTPAATAIPTARPRRASTPSWRTRSSPAPTPATGSARPFRFIGGGGVALSGRNGVCPILRSSKDQGQSNFINPGLLLLGVGADCRRPARAARSRPTSITCASQNTAVLEVLRQQGDDPATDIGWDLSAALTYRPFFTQNIVLRRLRRRPLPGSRASSDLYATPGRAALPLFRARRYRS